MVTRQQIIDKAREYLDTRYHHQGRVKGVGVDCAGLIVCVLTELGLPAPDVEGYGRRPDGSLRGHIETHMDRTTEPLPGDLVLFQWASAPFHVAILTAPDTIIHAYAINRKVCEHRMGSTFGPFVAGYYKFRGVE